MKRLLQSPKTGQISLLEVPAPRADGGQLAIHTHATLVSAGTERMLVEFGEASWIDKARQQPDKVRMVLEKVRMGRMVVASVLFGRYQTLQLAEAKPYDQPTPDPVLRTRFAEPSLVEALADSPVVFVHGQRQCGKRTLARMLGDKRGYGYTSFDDAATRASRRNASKSSAPAACCSSTTSANCAAGAGPASRR